MAIKIGNQTVIDNSGNWTGEKIANVEYGRSQTYQTISSDSSIGSTNTQGTTYGYVQYYKHCSLSSTVSLAVYDGGGGSKLLYIGTGSNTLSYGVVTNLTSGGAWTAGLGDGYQNLLALDSTRALCFTRVTGDSTQGLYVRVITVNSSSSVSLSANQRVSLSSDGIQEYQNATLLDTDKVLVQYTVTKPDGEYYLVARILTISGSTVTINSEFTVYMQSGQYMESATIIALSTTKAISVYEDRANSVKGTAVVLDINGLTITKGSPHVFAESSSSKIKGLSGTWHTNNVHPINSTNALVIYAEQNTWMTARVLTISGTTVTTSSVKLIFGRMSDSAMFTSTALTSNDFAVSYLPVSATDTNQLQSYQILRLYTNGSTITMGAAYSTEEDYFQYNAMSTISSSTILYGVHGGTATAVKISIIPFEKLTLTSSSPQYIKVTKDNVYDEITLPSVSGITEGFGRFIIENAGDSAITVGDSVNYTQVQAQDIMACNIINGKWTFLTLERRKDCVLFPSSVLHNNGLDMNYPLMSCKLTSTTGIAVYSVGTVINARVFTVTSSNDLTYGTTLTNIQTGYIMGVRQIDSTRVLVLFVTPQYTMQTIVLSVSGTTITAGTNVGIGGGSINGFVNISMFSSTHAIVSYVRNESGQNQSMHICLSISGTSISAGTEFNMNDNYSSGNYIYSCVAVNSTKALYVATTGGGTYSHLISRSGTTLTKINTLYIKEGFWIRNNAMTRLDDSRVLAISMTTSNMSAIVFNISNDIISYGARTGLFSRLGYFPLVKAIDSNTAIMSVNINDGIVEITGLVFTLMVYGNNIKVGKLSKFGSQSFSDVTPLSNDTAVITYVTEGTFDSNNTSLIRRGYGRVISIKDAI